jgi:hypothetical protein
MTGLGSVINTGSQPRKISLIRWLGSRRRRTRKQQPSQVCPFLVSANQFAHVFTAGAIAALLDLFVDESLHGFGQRDIHGAHGDKLDSLAKFGNRVARPVLNEVQLRRFSLNV